MISLQKLHVHFHDRKIMEKLSLENTPLVPYNLIRFLFKSDRCFVQGFSEFSLAGGEQKSSNVSPENGVLNLGGGGMDSMTGSLEDLVSTFDEKLTMCFADYQEQVDKIAPVQVKYITSWTINIWSSYSKNLYEVVKIDGLSLLYQKRG